MTLISSARNRRAFMLSAACLVFAACGSKEPEPSGALADTDSILRYVPADTPYVIANIEPLQDDLIEKMDVSGALSSAYAAAMEEAFTESIEEYPEGSEERREAEQAARVLPKVLSLFSVDGMRQAGFDINEGMAFYGYGLLPVLRAHVTDEAAFESAMAAIEEDIGKPMLTAELDGNTYRYVGDDDARMIVGVFGDTLVATMAPDEFPESELRKLLGLELPKNNIAAAGHLAALAEEFDYLPHYLGYMDFRKIAGSVVDPTPANAALLASGEGFDPESVSDVCREEVMAVAGVAPRLVFGYTEISTDAIVGSGVLELRDDIAAGLMTLPAAVPGLGKDHGQLFSFGMSINPGALRDFYAQRLDALEADPFECEYFAELDQNIERGRDMLAQPVPPVVYGFRGFVAVFNRLDTASVAAGAPPLDSEATVLVAIDGAPALVDMGTMLSPELAALDIQPDGKPVPLDVPMAGMLPATPYAAVTDSLLVVGTGEGADERVASLVAADPVEPSPFMSGAGDAGRYYELMGASMLDADESLSPETRDALQRGFKSMAEVYDRMRFDVYFTGRGVEFEATVTLHD